MSQRGKAGQAQRGVAHVTTIARTCGLPRAARLLAAGARLGGWRPAMHRRRRPPLRMRRRPVATVLGQQRCARRSGEATASTCGARWRRARACAVAHRRRAAMEAVRTVRTKSVCACVRACVSMGGGVGGWRMSRMAQLATSYQRDLGRVRWMAAAAPLMLVLAAAVTVRTRACVCGGGEGDHRALAQMRSCCCWQRWLLVSCELIRTSMVRRHWVWWWWWLGGGGGGGVGVCHEWLSWRRHTSATSGACAGWRRQRR